MMRNLLKLIVVIGVALPMFAIHETARAEQPHMESALELLQKAKTASEPIPLLEKAKNQVQTAKRNKGGRRPDAIEAIKDAIEIAKKGGNPEAKINHAIAMIHSGEDRAR